MKPIQHGSAHLRVVFPAGPNWHSVDTAKICKMSGYTTFDDFTTLFGGRDSYDSPYFSVWVFGDVPFVFEI